MNESKLLRFSLTNFRSFNDTQELDFRQNDGVRAVTAIYGPNSSGKSNIARALKLTAELIRSSTHASITQLPYDPFLLNVNSTKQPTKFELELVHNKKHLIYYFSYDKDSIKSEGLYEFASKTKKKRKVFERLNNGVNPTAEKFGFNNKLFTQTRPNSLLITKARENNNPYSNIIFDWLDNFNVLFGSEDETIQWSLKQLSDDTSLKEPVLELLKKADLWIRSINIQEFEIPFDDISRLPFNDDVKKQLVSNKQKPLSIKTSHAIRDDKHNIVGEILFDMKNGESLGTKRFFELAAPLINTLQNGKVLFIDEFETHLHPEISNLIVDLFKSEMNTGNAQLIFNTHDTSLMSQDGPLEREEIMFIEKNYIEESKIVPLTSKSVRSDEPFEKRYRQGLYGARPQIEKRKK